ncbi:hypothetical protein ACFQBQ_07685 [Granulicella cerasi]|uniref:Uncharacterized protein n=1 Tax=Granulicella cerasi TaxID=741063 RepID=A0ABW1Z8T8_9BACT|nr:hypothetical protein [Granulicella cerasi]
MSTIPVPPFPTEQKSITSEELKFREAALRHATALQSVAIFAYLFMALLAGMYSASLGRSYDGGFNFFVAAICSLFALSPIPFLASAYANDMRRRHAFMDRS